MRGGGAVHIRYGSGEGGTRWEGNDGRAGGRRRVRCAVQFFAQAIDSCGLTLEPSVGRSVCLSDAGLSAYEYIDINATAKMPRSQCVLNASSQSAVCCARTQPHQSFALATSYTAKTPSRPQVPARRCSRSVAVFTPTLEASTSGRRRSNFAVSNHVKLWVHQVSFVQFGNGRRLLGQRPSQTTAKYLPCSRS